MGRGEAPELDTPPRSVSVFERAQITLPERLYHVSSAAAAAGLTERGICTAPIGTRRPGGLTTGGEWADSLYGVRPVYLSVRPWEIEASERSAHALFEVESLKLDLKLCSVDAPSLIDHGMCLNSSGVYWEEGDPAGDQIHELLGEEIPLEGLLSSAELTKIGFELTGSLALSGDVPAEAIRRIEWPVE